VRTLTLSFVALPLAALLIGAAGCDGKELPPYAYWLPDGALEIRVEEADPNASYFEDYEAIMYEYGNYTCRYQFSGSQCFDSTGCPSISISPFVVPGDGVLDLFAAMWTDAANNMNVGLFIDTDWIQLEGQLQLLAVDYVYASANGDEEVLTPRQREAIPINPSGAIDGVLYYEVRSFPQLTDYCAPVLVAVTNVEGEYMDIARKFVQLDQEAGEVLSGLLGPLY
jgi:hypothetical protein